MIKMVVALCLFINGQLIEHRIQDTIGDCLMKKRIAQRNSSDNIRYMCGEVKAELQNNIDGSKSIKKIIEPK